MMPPKPKQVSKFAPDILRKMIPQTIERHYSMMSYDSRDGGCPRCKSEHVVGFGWVSRTFCSLITERGTFEDVHVKIRRYLCRHCKHTFFAKDSPFYQGCNYGKPIVDLCLALAASNPYNRVESILMQYGIQVDRDTVKGYALVFRDGAIKKMGIPVMMDSDAKIGVNILKMLFDVENVKELKEKYPSGRQSTILSWTKRFQGRRALRKLLPGKDTTRA
jgi:transposase-like protein